MFVDCPIASASLTTSSRTLTQVARKSVEPAIKSFDVNLLLTLAILLQTRSVGRTAKRLGLSQPTVSRALGQLRELLADPILVRSGGRMALTQRAVELAAPLEEWMAITSTVLQPADFAPSTLDRSFIVAASDYGMLSVVSPILSDLSRLSPHCRIEVVSYSEDMFAKLASGELDLIVHGFKPDMSVTHAQHLFGESQSIVVRPGHPITRGGPPISLDDYLAWPHIAISIGPDAYDHVRFCLGERDAERKVSVRLPYFYAAPDLIHASDAILTMPTRAATHFAQLHGFTCLPAPDIITGFDYWVLWHERSTRDPATRWLIDMLVAGGSETGRMRGELMRLTA
jgi:DNA-binding transcriptional LysR family regulator